MATLRDIAEYAGVSIATACMAVKDDQSISLKTRQLVWEAQEKLGYRGGRKGRGGKRDSGPENSGKTKVIGFLMIDRLFDDPVYSSNFQGFANAVEARQWRNVYIMTSLKKLHEGDLPSALKNREVDGFIVTGVLDEAAYRRLQKWGIPFVVLGNYSLGDQPWAACELDHALGMRLLVNRLAGLGHSRFGFLMRADIGESDRKLRQWYLLETAREGIVNVGIEVESECGSISNGMRNLVAKSPSPTALLLSTPTMAEEVYDFCESNRLNIPGDLSIAAVGAVTYPMRPTLARVEVRAEEYGEAAMNKLAHLVEHPNAMLTRELCPVEFVPGGSITSLRESLK